MLSTKPPAPRALCSRGLIHLALALLAAAPLAEAQMADAYFMAVHGCDDPSVDCHTPINHNTYLLSSDDGVNWTPVAGWTAFHGSVPDLIRRGDTLYLYSPNQLTRYHIDTGVIEGPLNVTLNGASTTGGFVDPSLYLDDQGRLVLFYLPGILGMDPAGCPPASTTCTKYILSAVEVKGSNGEVFDVVDERLTVPTGGSDPPSASDPDIFLAGDTYVVLLARGASTQVWTSDSLHGTYEKSTDLPGGFLWTGGPAVASALYDHQSGETWLYGHTNLPIEGNVQRAVTTDLTSPIPSSFWVTILTPGDLGLSSSTGLLGSPALARNVTSAATAKAFGSGCPGSGPVVIDTADLPPELGQPDFSLTVTGVSPGAAGWIMLGSSDSSWEGLPLPLSLVSLGFPGCDLLVSPDLAMAAVTAGAAGQAQVTLAVPGDPVFLGLTLFAQGAFLAPGLALEMSQGLALTLGLQ